MGPALAGAVVVGTGDLMPATVMPASIQTELNDILRRLTALETFPSNGMTVLTEKYAATNDVFAYNTTYQSLPEVTPASFTVLRPVPILLVANLSYFDTGGTAEFIQVYGGLSLTNNVGHNADALDINGTAIAHVAGTLSCGFLSPTSGASLMANYSAAYSWIIPAGTYYAHINYRMVGGATTTITENDAAIAVFQLSG